MSDHDAFYSIFSRIANHTDNTHKNQYVCQNILLCHSYHEYREATCVKNIIIAESSSSLSNTHQEFGEHRHRTSNQNPISGDLERSETPRRGCSRKENRDIECQSVRGWNVRGRDENE